MSLTNAERHYFDALLREDIELYQSRSIDADEAAAGAEVPGLPYHQSQVEQAAFNRGVVQGLRLAAENLDKAQT